MASELIMKEKQFIKLNQQLDRMAIGAGAGHEADGYKGDNRFYTYQKSKGPSTLLKKHGAGDGITGLVTDVTNIKEPKIYNKVAGGDTHRSPTRANPTSTFQVQDTFPTGLPQYRPKQKKCSESVRSQNPNRVNNCRVVPSNNSTFTIKYRNPKFIESPSLEVLVKEESNALRCQTEALRIGSVNSIPIEEGVATERSSKTSNHTVASKRNVSSEGLIKFLKSKIVILEEDHERISQEMAKQKELLDTALEHTKNLEQQRDQARSKTYSLTDQLAKVEKQLEEANKRLKERVVDQNVQQRDLETAKRELKLLTQTNSNLEKRLLKANEDLESARNTLSLMKTNEREQKEAARKETDNKESQIKSLKKQRANLLNAYKKQLFLIDNLKRQNILLEQSKMLDFKEKEFAKALNWKLKS